MYNNALILCIVGVSSRTFCKEWQELAKIFAGVVVNSMQSKLVLVKCQPNLRWSNPSARWGECPTLPHPETLADSAVLGVVNNH